MVYCMHVALFWKSMVVLEESVVEFVQYPLDMSEIFDYTNTYEHINYCWIVLNTFLYVSVV